MKIIDTFLAIATILCSFACKNTFQGENNVGRIEKFNNDWQFIKDIKVESDSALFLHTSKLNWQNVDLPHTAQIEPLVIKGNQWQGICYYRKFFSINKNDKGKHLAIKFDGAMQVADVYLNGKKLKTNYGGYLPFYIDITDFVDFDKENCLLVKLDNNDNPQVPPGKPVSTLDFNIYGGIYRNVWFIAKNKLHITDPSEVDKVAGGGIFVTYPEINNDSAKINVEVDVSDAGKENSKVKVVAELLDKEGKNVAKGKSSLLIDSTNGLVFSLDLSLKSPNLWSTDVPYLYTLNISVYKSDKLIDTKTLKIGLRNFSFTGNEGFKLNGKPLKLRGTNRHQEYPYIGYAISDNANYRDAYKIKQAGFNFVRLSHYPHSESFIDACDELGILVMDAIPGWQFFGDSVFQQNSISDARRMVRRDRNHPSIILWEASLNESGMTKDFMQKAHHAVHEEYPGKGVYTAGWIDDVYDVYVPARQHAKPPYYWNKYDKNKPIIIAEYGDWEYYAQNAGFNQKAYKDLSEEERNSRQFRAYGQRRLLQQAINFQEAHNDNMDGKSAGDANWLMFDYNRGYAPDIEASGIMDIFRLPKFSFYFYQSQADINEKSQEGFGKPMVYIANYYNDPSFLEIKVYSNCQEMELRIDGKSMDRQKPDNDRNSTNLKHPPFTFKLNDFVPGKLEAIGYIDGKVAAISVQQTQGTATGLKIWIHESGKPLEKGINDVVFLYAAIVDQNGTIIPEATNRVNFSIEGDAEMIGTNPIEAEAGITTILLKAGKKGGLIKVSANAEGLKSVEYKINVP